MYIGKFGYDSNYTSYAIMGYTGPSGNRQYCGSIDNKGGVGCGTGKDNVSARKDFCQKHGPVSCPNGVNMCYGEKCPTYLFTGTKAPNQVGVSSGGLKGGSGASAKGSAVIGGASGSGILGGAPGTSKTTSGRLVGSGGLSGSGNAGVASGISARGSTGLELLPQAVQDAIAPVIDGYGNIGDSLKAAGLPPWLLPAGIAGLGLVLVIVIFKK